MRVLASIVAAIEGHGLAARGAFPTGEADRAHGLDGLATIVLVGAAGSTGWDVFARSPEAGDGRGHPLDRWSRRVIDALALEMGAKALYPFGGPPHWPFQRWALRAESVHASPLGLLIHPDHGLWHSYRGALGFAEPIAMPQQELRASPCAICAGRPCLSACPVGAFSIDRFDAAACAGHLRRPEGGACLEEGCLARRACPVGVDRAHPPAQAGFHMRAFLAAQPSN